MATFNGRISDGADDGYIAAPSTISIVSNQILFCNSHEADSLWFRWPNVTIPQGSTINSAVVTLTPFGAQPNNTANANIYFDNEDTATAPTSYADYTGKPVTAAVAWNAIPATLGGVGYNTPDVATILQTVINRAGWVSGNALQVFIQDNSSSTGASRDAISYEDSPTTAAAIAVTYSLPASTTVSYGGSMPLTAIIRSHKVIGY